MTISILLAKEIIKLFIIMIAGYTLVKTNLLKASDSKSISVILVYLVTPCVIINSFQVKYTQEIQKGLVLAFVAAILIHILFLVLTALLKKPLQLNVIEKATVIYSNAGILVIPLVNELLGSDYIIYSSAFIAVQLILLWTHCKMMLCEDERIEWKKILFNINILSIILGLFLFIFHITLPSDVQDIFDQMGNMIGPLGMLLAGMVIAEVPLSSVFALKRNYVSTILRLILYPIFSLLLLKAMSSFYTMTHMKEILLTVYLASITPACATITSMAQLYDKDASYSSSLYVLTTLLSILSMPIMVYLYELFI